jgi:hypothetical protein
MVIVAAQRSFFGVSALLFAASVAVTIVWCASMSAMGAMPMPGGWTMSMAWMRTPGQQWIYWVLALVLAFTQLAAIDFQNSHETIWCGYANPWRHQPYIDANAPKEYFNGVKYGSPSGLMQILR